MLSRASASSSSPCAGSFVPGASVAAGAEVRAMSFDTGASPAAAASGDASRRRPRGARWRLPPAAVAGEGDEAGEADGVDEGRSGSGSGSTPNRSN
ncbi:hypothetical protein ABZO35_12035 [Burkholderia pseudomallei]